LLPLLGFTLQELLERWPAGSSFPWWVVLQSTFHVGLPLQLPFAVAAYLLARLLFRTSKRTECLDSARRRWPSRLCGSLPQARRRTPA
jgi:hypothetical protein